MANGTPSSVVSLDDEDMLTPPNNNENAFSTPKNSLRHRALDNLRKEVSRSPLLQIPSTPLMERLGYGTGVGVFTLNRSPRSTGTRSPWAIKKTMKVHDTSELYSDRLEYEAEILRKLSHPNIIGYRAFGKPSPDTTYLAMEKAPKSLADLIEERVEEVMLIVNCDAAAPFPAKTMEKMALDVSKALEYLHDQVRMVHGDVKSANVLVFGDFETMKLCDFGVARKINAQGVVEGGYVGTEIWNAKEVVDYKQGCGGSPPTYKADIYSFGLTIYEMISLKPPHLSDAEESILEPEKSFNASADSFGKDDLSFDISFDELAYDAALARHVGTRPPLPDIDFDPTYNTILGIFFCCTDVDPAKRPDAKDIVASIAGP